MIGIGDYDAKGRNRRKVRTTEGQYFYKGVKYSVEKETGYMVATTGARRRLHVVMWETEHGEKVGDGYVIHHIDWNKRNNKISNLVKLTVQEHNLIHNPPPLARVTEEELKIMQDLKHRGLM